jgi:glycosyltransferase involved in cell wall biosynthesis
VTLLGEGGPPAWWPLGEGWLDRTRPLPRLPAQDLVIGTFWTTLPAARALGLGPLAHFCQGYEGYLEHLAPQLPRIEEVYSWPLPALTVSPHLATLLHDRFGRESRVVPPPLDPAFAPAPRAAPSAVPWVLVPGIFEAPVKGVRTALAAVRALRASGVDLRLLRLSILPLSPQERALLEPDRYLCGVPPAQVAAELRASDLLLLASRAGEGFGLPLLEAMASGVPAVASRIPSTAAMADGAVALVDAADAEAFAAAAARLLGDAAAWRAARESGLRAAERFAPARVAEALDAAVRWAATYSPSPAAPAPAGSR